MISERIHHYATLLFLLALIFTQGLVFVGTRAAVQSRDELRVAFLNQELSLPVQQGAEEQLRAIISNAKYDKFSLVYFTVRNINTGEEMNFDAALQSDGSWLTDASWQTDGFVPGDYLLYATAQIYDNGDARATLVSKGMPIQLAAVPPAQGTGNDSQDTSGEETSSSTDSGTSTEEPPVVVTTSTSAFTAQLLSPDTDQPLTSEVELTLELNNEPSASTTIGLLFDYQGDLQNIVLPKKSAKQFGGILDTQDYDDGAYQWIFYMENGNEVTNLLAVEVEIDNSSLPGFTERMINFEKPSDTIEGNILNANFSTNFQASKFSMELVNKNNATISTGKIEIPITDGFGWNKTVTLGDIFVDGQYQLIATATDAESGEIVEGVYDLSFDLPDNTTIIDYNTLQLTLENPGSNVSGTVIFRVKTNQQNINGNFILTSTIDKDKNYTVRSLGAGSQSVASVDTSTIDDGNYQLRWQIEENGEVKAKTENILITIFNGQEENATSTDELTSTSTPSDEGHQLAIGTHLPDCASLGVTDTEECKKLQAELSGNIDPICLTQQIYEPAACEDYLNRIIVDGQCQAQGVIDREACKDYFLEKYAGKISCRLSDQTQCTTVLRESYLNRMVNASEKAEAIDTALQNKPADTTTLEQFRKLLTDNAVKDLSLPLQNDQALVLSLPSTAERVLENENFLTIRNSVVLVLDSDADGLPDDLENFYNASIDNPDTDGDGYLDGQEVKNGYDPAGPGILPEKEVQQSSVSRVVFAGQVLQQPLLYPTDVSTDLKLDKIGQVAGLTQFSGKAPAYAWVTIYIYSDVPLVATAHADSAGNWSYTLGQQLADGYHKIFLAQNDETGKIASQSQQNYFKITQNKVESPVSAPTETSTDKRSFSQMLIYYGLGVLVIVLGALLAFLLIRRKKKEKTPMSESGDKIDYDTVSYPDNKEKTAE